MRINVRGAGAALGSFWLFIGSAHAAEPADSASADSQDSLKTVVVTGSPLTDNPDKLSTNVDSVSRDQIVRSGGANLADALSDVPGVSATTFASGASRPVIRGFDANRVKTLEDGVGTFDVSDVGPDHGVPVDPLSAQRIEVVRGPGTLRYGSQAIGGVVNAINDRVPMKLNDQPVTGEVDAGYGTGSDSKDAAGLVDGSVGQFALHADAFGRRTHDYDIPNGVQTNSFFRGDGYSGGGSYFFGDQNASHVGLGVIHSDAKYGIPSDTTWIDMHQTKELLRSSFALGYGPIKTLTVEGGYGDYQHKERNPDGSTNSTFLDKEWDSRAELLFDAIGPLSGSALGVQFQHKDFSAIGADSSYLFPTVTKSAAVFFFTELPVNQQFRFQAGARVEDVRIQGTPSTDIPTERGFTPISGSIGALYDLAQNIHLGLTASSTARAPAQTELFARGAHDGPLTFETGDPWLKIERSNSLEASLRVHGDRVTFEGSVWGARFENYIYGALTGRTCDDDGVCTPGDDEELRELNYEQFDATFYGVEGKSTVTLLGDQSGKLAGLLLGDYVRAKLSDQAGNVPRIPPYHIGAGLTWQSPRWDARVLAKYSGDHTDVAFAETPTGGFLNLDADIEVRPVVTLPGFELVVTGSNLLNRDERNSVSFNKDVVLLPGRDVRAMFRLSF
ncbi:MAG: iron complex outerrane recepter protein [Gammaproteobacteria bacterium]|nr:iron complex outerrane recepter protein [Gammaproteobacteria bacterium]